MVKEYFNEKEKRTITSLKKRIIYLEGEVFGKSLMLMGKRELLNEWYKELFHDGFVDSITMTKKDFVKKLKELSMSKK